MPALVLLNGPPASGKSTMASRMVELRPLALNLDIDVVRHQLGAWLDQPADAGLAARRLALAMAQTHLGDGRDVVIPQYLGRVEFIEQLDELATNVGVPFFEILLELPRSAAIDAFDRRKVESTDPIHADGNRYVERLDSPNVIAEYWDRLQELTAHRPPQRTVPVVLGDIDTTFATLISTLHEIGLDW